MSLDKSSLFEFLEELDKELNFEITLIAVGGTALTLLNVKPSTIDIDFTIPNHFEEFRNILKVVPHGFKVDTYPDRTVFTQTLPHDYVIMSEPINTPNLEKIKLRSLHPIDIVVTKIGRLCDRDIQDIGVCIARFELKKSDIIERASLIGYAGNEQIYESNLQFVVNTFFKS
jgi:Nucleotidyltransferase of unknown function (DUF6036)